MIWLWLLMIIGLGFVFAALAKLLSTNGGRLLLLAVAVIPILAFLQGGAAPNMAAQPPQPDCTVLANRYIDPCASLILAQQQAPQPAAPQRVCSGDNPYCCDADCWAEANRQLIASHPPPVQSERESDTTPDCKASIYDYRIPIGQAYKQVWGWVDNKHRVSHSPFHSHDAALAACRVAMGEISPIADPHVQALQQLLSVDLSPLN